MYYLIKEFSSNTVSLGLWKPERRKPTAKCTLSTWMALSEAMSTLFRAFGELLGHFWTGSLLFSSFCIINPNYFPLLLFCSFRLGMSDLDQCVLSYQLLITWL